MRLAALRLAELFAGPGTVCTAVAPSRASQRLLARQGFRPHAVVNYHEWKDEQGQAIIRGAGMGNYSAVLAVYEVSRREVRDDRHRHMPNADGVLSRCCRARQARRWT